MANPALTGEYDGVDMGDIVCKEKFFGIVVGTPGFFHADILWEDGSRTVIPRRFLRPPFLSKEALYYGPISKLREWFELWSPEEEFHVR